MVSKRIYDTRVKKWAIGSGLVGIPLALLIFMFLSSNGYIIITGYSGDITCAGTHEEPCYAYINFTPVVDIFIYPTNESTWMFNTEPTVKSLKMYRSWGSGWRELDFMRKCNGTWCGKSPTDKRKEAEFIVAFRAGREYQIRFVAEKYNITDNIKWGFGTIDPSWNGYTSDDFFVKLIDNKASLTYGEAIFKITNPTTFKIDTNLNILLNNMEGATDVIGIEYFEQKVKYKTVTDYIIIKNKKTCKRIITNNVTKIRSIENYDCSTYRKIENGSHVTNITSYKGINSKITLLPKASKVFKIKANWKAKLGLNSHEWFPEINISGTRLKQSKWAWWNSSYGKRILINITNMNLTDVLEVNYTINFTVNTTNPNMNTSGDDIRIIYNGITELHRVNVTPFNSTTTIIEFMLQNNITAGASDDTNYYMYYNNTLATSPPSNETQVYIFADFFNNQDLERPVNWTISTGSAIETSAGELQLSGNDVTEDLLEANYTINLEERGYKWEWYYQANVQGSSSNWNSQIRFSTQNSTDYFIELLQDDSGTIVGRDMAITLNGVQTNLIVPGDRVADASWHKITIIRDSGGNWEVFEDDSSLGTAINSSLTNSTIFYIKKRGFQAKTLYLDNITVRRYMTPGPNVTVGSEESVSTEISTNLTSWNGTTWADPFIYFPTYYCNLNESYCTSDVYNASRGDFNVNNNGTSAGNGIDLRLNETLVDLNYSCSNQSNRTAGSFFQVNLTSTYQSVHNGSIAVGGNVELWCWLTVGVAPKEDQFIEIMANII